MRERTEYPAGVPCWVDTSQPDPEAAAAFYGGLFGWEFEDRTPPGMPGRYLVAQLRGRDVAAVSSPPPGRPRLPPGAPTSRSTAPTRPSRGHWRRAAPR